MTFTDSRSVQINILENMLRLLVKLCSIVVIPKEGHISSLQLDYIFLLIISNPHQKGIYKAWNA